MIKAIVLIIAVLSVSVLSGCVDNSKSIAANGTDAGNINANINASAETDTVVNSTVESETGKEAGNETKTLKVSSGVINLSDQGGKSPATSNAVQDWCKPGSKIMVNLLSGEKEFTVTGITTYDGREVCHAEMNFPNGKTNKYFSKDGKFEAMNASASGPGSVYSEAKTSVNSSG